MKTFYIQPVSTALKTDIQHKIDNLAKPKASLGVLERLALKVCSIQNTLTPQLKVPHNVIFAGDHGIVEEGVSKSPKEITWQQLINFTQGGGGINFLCRQHHFELKLVDVGVDYDFPSELNIIHRKLRKGTTNYLHAPAMSYPEMETCMQIGADIVNDIYTQGCNIISFGEMGIGNTSSSSIWMHLFTNTPLKECIGAGSGLNDEGILHKYKVLAKAVENFQETHTPTEIIRYFGGFEMVAAIGAMLQAAEKGMVIIIDGFIMTACLLAATQLYPQVIDYAIFGHCGDELGHRRLLEHLKVESVLHLQFRLGEGTGAVCSYPIIESAVRMINEMKCFNEASITKYF